MKKQTIVKLMIFTLLSAAVLPGCAVFKGKKGKKDCDCPSFSKYEERAQPGADLTAASGAALFYHAGSE